jgi:hypothetical protein
MAPVRVKWINGLVDAGDLPHLLPVDPTLHWANPSGGASGRDMRPTFESTPDRYTGPVPIVTHLHGGHTAEESDGYAEAWYLPAGAAPSGYAAVGSKYDEFKAKFADAWGMTWDPGSAVFQYDNDQRAATLWYHDHTLGMTRLNVYAGPAGFYLLRGGPDASPAYPVRLLRSAIRARGSVDTSTPAGELALPTFTPLGPAQKTRQVSLNEADSNLLPGVGPRAAFLGTVRKDGTGNPLEWMAPPTENVRLGATEVWELHNFTEDAHPIHIHEVQFQVVNRESFESGTTRGPESWESGYKDTVIAYPDEITRVKAKFDHSGLFVWHCHIVDHEDNEMMRPYTIG